MEESYYWAYVLDQPGCCPTASGCQCSPPDYAPTYGQQTYTDCTTSTTTTTTTTTLEPCGDVPEFYCAYEWIGPPEDISVLYASHCKETCFCDESVPGVAEYLPCHR
jgi:hypothetical protein